MAAVGMSEQNQTHRPSDFSYSDMASAAAHSNKESMSSAVTHRGFTNVCCCTNVLLSLTELKRCKSVLQMSSTLI